MNNSLVVYNSLKGEKENFKPILPNNVGMYVCGPTVYSNIHPVSYTHLRAHET